MIRALRSLYAAITVSVFCIIVTLFISCSNDNPFDPEEDESVPAGWVVQNPYPRGQALRGVSVADAMTATVVGSDGIILRTVDGGESWEIQESGVDVFLYDVSFATPDIGTVIGAKIVLRTVDGGATWTKQVSITDPQATSNFSNVCFSHPDTGSISHSGNLMMTTDGGDSWIDRRICYDYIYEVSFCDTRNGMALISRSVLRTYDGGITWAGCQLPSYPFPFSMSMFDPHNAYITAVGYGFPGYRAVALFKTTDGGDTWQNVIQSKSLGEQVTCVDDQIVITAGTHGVINRSEDGGVTWEPRDSGTDADLRAISFSGRDLGIAVGEEGKIVRSLDGGDTWEVVSRGSHRDLNDVFFTSPLKGTAVGLWGTVLRTSDGGNTWKEQTTASANPYELTLDAVEFSDEDNGIAVGNAGIIISTADGGGTWTMRAMSEDPGMALFGLDLIDENIGTAVGESGRIIRTVDGGVTWTEQECPPEQWLFDVDFLDAARGIAVGSSGAIMRTEDGGETSESVPVDQDQLLYGVAVLDENRAFAVGRDGQIIRTTDGGDRWFIWPSGTGSDLYSVSFLDGINGLIVGDNVILRTFDGGETWERQETPQEVYLRGSQCIDTDILTAVGLGGAIIRADGNTD